MGIIKYSSILILLIILMLFNASFGTCHRCEKAQSIKFLGYEIILEHKGSAIEKEDSVKIFKDKKLIKEIKNYSIIINNIGYLKFKGDKQLTPYLVLITYSGGVHCCAGIEAYELFPHFKKSFEYFGDMGAKIISVSSEGAEGEGEYFLKVVDNHFLYWHASYLDSPHVPLYLKKGKDGLEVCDNCIYQSIEERHVLELAKYLRGREDIWVSISPYPRQIVEEVARLTYMNQGKLAEKFLETAWNPKNPRKENFKKDFITLLKKNSYWQQFEKKGYLLPFQKD